MSTVSSTWWGGNNYSTEEQVIGTWIDGKPLYQKIIIQKLTSNTGAVYPSYNHGISNVETIWCDTANSMLRPNENEYNPLPYVNPNYATSEVSIYGVTSTGYIIASGSDRSTWTAYITFKYTKTTD